MSHSPDIESYLRIFPDYRDLAGAMFRRHLSFDRPPKGAFICEVGTYLSHLTFMLGGRARVFLPLFAGREYLFRVYQQGDVVGDLEFFLGVAPMCSVQCTADAHVATFPVAVVREHRVELLEPILALGRGVAEKLRQNSVSEAVSTGYPAMARLAAYFLRLSDSHMAARNLAELSDWLGISYRHLTRTLAGLVAAGALSKCGREYAVLDRGALERIASEVMQEEPLRL